MNLLTNSIYQFQFINLIVHSSIQHFTNSSINQSNSSAIHQSNSSSNHQFTNSLLHQFINSSFNQFINLTVHQFTNLTSIHQSTNSLIHQFIHPSFILKVCWFTFSRGNESRKFIIVVASIKVLPMQQQGSCWSRSLTSYMQSLQQQKVNKVV